MEPKLSHQLNELVHDVSIGFLAPIFFVTAGFHVSLDVFGPELLPLLVAVTVVATVGKIVGTALFYLPSGHGWREGLTVGAGMNGRGAVEIIIAQVGLGLGVISAEIFSILVFMAIFTTATVPLFLKWTTDWLDRRGELVRAREERAGTLILSAAPTARLLAKRLAETEPVWLIDKNQYNCDMAAAEGLNVVCGDALDEDVLHQANAGRLRRFLALTPNAEVNALAAQLAREVFRIGDVKVLLTHTNGSLRRVLERQSMEVIHAQWEEISEWDHWLEIGEAAEVGVNVDSSNGQKVRASGRTLPLLVARNGERIPFPSVESVDPGDVIYTLQRRNQEQ